MVGVSLRRDRTKKKQLINTKTTFYGDIGRALKVNYLHSFSFWIQILCQKNSYRTPLAILHTRQFIYGYCFTLWLADGFYFQTLKCEKNIYDSSNSVTLSLTFLTLPHLYYMQHHWIYLQSRRWRSGQFRELNHMNSTANSISFFVFDFDIEHARLR